jgi:hypothetical protein
LFISDIYIWVPDCRSSNTGIVSVGRLDRWVRWHDLPHYHTLDVICRYNALL